MVAKKPDSPDSPDSPDGHARETASDPALEAPLDARRDARTDLGLEGDARDAAITILREHYAKDRLSLEDFEGRVERAERAMTRAELERSLAGLPVVGEVVSRSSRDGGLAPAVPAVQPPAIRAILGATSRRGRFPVPARLAVRATLGAVRVDLCEADLPADEVVIDVRAVLGSVEVVVPEGLAVTCEGNAVLGAFEQVDVASRSSRDRRRVRIVGTAWLGSVEVIVQRRGTTGVLAAVRGLLGQGRDPSSDDKRR